MRPPKYAHESTAEVTHLVLPSHANTIGVTFGGQIMAWYANNRYINHIDTSPILSYIIRSTLSPLVLVTYNIIILNYI